MTDFLYPDILNEQLTYARQARAAWLWTNVAERSRIFLQVLDTLQPICASLARDSVQETGYGIFEDRMLMITRLLRDLRSCCLQTESPFSERLSCTDTHTQSQPSGTLLGIPSSIHPVTETLFAAAIAIQTGNPLIFFFSDSAFQISARTAPWSVMLQLLPVHLTTAFNGWKLLMTTCLKNAITVPTSAALFFPDFPPISAKYFLLFQRNVSFPFHSLLSAISTTVLIRHLLQGRLFYPKPLTTECA
ncbi:hypothetical protein DW070_06210 [Coprococcus catus]|uniref:Uncharacterized protein n=1 Tax=Coprococcus catus TaxID=116085 RepID=A0A3E2TPC4_9FIRM|nr:hypothetical protein DW070_06210 [Coprococcus catus]